MCKYWIFVLPFIASIINFIISDALLLELNIMGLVSIAKGFKYADVDFPLVGLGGIDVISFPERFMSAA